MYKLSVTYFLKITIQISILGEFMSELTGSRKKILEFLIKRTSDGIPPSIREICEATGLKSTSTVHFHLKALEDDGYITRNGNINRGLQVTGISDVKSHSVPILGKITAGMPIYAFEDIDGYVPVSDDIAKNGELFALNVSGNSMINAGILDGDIAVFKRTQAVENGNIVAALIDDEATVKRFFAENGHYRLQPENPDYEPIIVDELTVLGKLVTLIRYY